MNAKLVMYTNDGQRRVFSLSKPVTVIGRAEDCDLKIPLANVSRHHCQLSLSGEDLVTVKDLGSTNGTYVNTKPVEEVQLNPGDRLTVGPVVLTLKLNGVPEEPARIEPADELSPSAAAADGDEEQFDFEAAIAEEAEQTTQGEMDTDHEVKAPAEAEADPLEDLEALAQGDEAQDDTPQPPETS